MNLNWKESSEGQGGLESMAKPNGTFRNLLIWTYERGTLKYDIICALILAFIFFVPRSCFISKRTDTAHVARPSTGAPAPGVAGGGEIPESKK
jgi:hypothetical protein